MADSTSPSAGPTSPAAVITASRQSWPKSLVSHASDLAALAAAVALLVAISFITVGLRNSALTSATDPAPSSARTFHSGFSTSNALKHLTAITQSEHPLPSRANWAVRDYLIAQLNTLATSPKGRERKVEVINPTPWISYPQGDALRILAPTASGGAVFLQSSNVYFRIPGRNELEKGDRTSLLLSAHYDSVPTSKGVGDDGLGISALLELARLALQAEPLSYSLVFNLNNGEELGLYGAHELVRHPLWKDLAAFVNIDSVCPTGRPLLYRATSREMIELFSQHAPYPHASVLGQELMNAGLIRSDTDFSVYWRAGVTGVDFAFYDRRWVYHTDLDNASLLQPESLSLLGHNVASLMHGINQTGIQYIRRTPEPRNVVYTDAVGRSMFVIPYWGLATLAFIMSAIFLLVPIGVRTALKATVKSLRTGTRSVLGAMPLTGGAVQLRQWGMSTLAALGGLVLIIAGTVGIVLIVLSIQPMAVSGRPTGVFALAILACVFMPALIATGTRRWTRNGRINLHHGVLGLWLILLPLVGVASMSTAFFVHVFWFGLAYVLGALGLEVANWVSVVRFGHGDGGGGSANALSPTEQSALLRRADSSASSDDASPLPSSPAIAEAASSPLDSAIPSLIAPLRSTWSQCLLFAISSIVPFMVALDFAFVYVYGMGFAIQEGLSPAILAGFFTLFIFPLSLNIVPLLSSIPARIIRITTLLLLLGVVILGIVLTASFPFTPDAPVKLSLRIASAFNAVLDRTNVTSASASAITFARSPTDVQVTLGELPQRPSLDTSSLLGDIKPDACTQHACTYSSAKLGHANLPYPTANFSIQQPPPTAPGADPLASTLVSITAPASLVFCTIGGIPASKLDGARVLVASSASSASASDPGSNATLTLAAPEFRLIASNPSHTVSAQLVAPPAWAVQQWSLSCRLMANDDAEGRVYALYRSVLDRIPPYVSLTFASMSGGRALMVAEYTVIVPPVSDGPGGAGRVGEGVGRLNARGVWDLFRGLFD